MAEGQSTPDHRGLEINLFGQLRLRHCGQHVKFRAPSKAASLLAYLLLHQDEKVSRERLSFLLWPDNEENKARANLRRHILLLQKAIPSDAALPWIIADHSFVQWNPECACELDVAHFERLSENASSLAEAARLYSGDLLGDLYDDWIIPERERLRRMQTVNLERLLEQHRRNRDFAGAISSAQALLAHDPWREDTVRSLMSLRYESGDRAGALQEYENFAARLRHDMQVDPMPETVAKNEAILRLDSSFDQSVRDGAGQDETAVSTIRPFVGRDAEVRRLEEWWGRAARGHGRVVLIGGESGIGKSRLASELSHVAETQGGRIILGRTTHPEKAPYQAVVEALRGALPMISALEIEPIWLAAASTLLPELRDFQRKLPKLAPLEPQRHQVRLFEALARCIEGIAHARPLVVILEDLHWAGAGTAAFLAYLARRVGNQPVLAVATYRMRI